MKAPALLRAFTQAIDPSLPSALIQVLSQPAEAVKSADSLSEQLKAELDSSGESAAHIASTLINNSASWKVLTHFPLVGDSLVEFAAKQEKEHAKKLFWGLLMKGTQGTYRKVFRKSQATTILTETCLPAEDIPWRRITAASAFMRLQSYSDPYILDQFTTRALRPDAPINDLADFLHTTWMFQPINFELEWLFRLRLHREWKLLNDRMILRVIITLLKSPVRGDMLTYLRLIRRVDKHFVDYLNPRELVMCLGVMAKCRSRQMDIDQSLFEYVADRCKVSLKLADSKMLFIMGQALSQVNFKEKDFFTLLKNSAHEKKEEIEYLDFLVQTASPSIEDVEKY